MIETTKIVLDLTGIFLIVFNGLTAVERELHLAGSAVGRHIHQKIPGKSIHALASALLVLVDFRGFHSEHLPFLTPLVYHAMD